MNTKKYWMIAAGVLLLLLVLGAAALLLPGNDPAEQVRFTREITVRDGVASPEVFVCNVKLPKDGVYRINAEWASEPGLITCIRLRNADGEVLFGATAESLRMESNGLRLKAGDYTMEFTFLSNAASLTEIIRSFPADESGESGEWLTDADGKRTAPADYPFKPNGVWRNEYVYTVEQSGAFRAGKLAGLVTGIVLGLIVAGAILILSKKNRRLHAEYDERQQVARGKGYRVGFWTAFAFYVLLIFLDMAEIRLPAEDSVILFTGMLLSTFTFVVTCIRTDAYLALNEKPKMISRCLLILAAINIVLGIFTFIDGKAIVDGMLTVRSINFICGIFLLLISAVLFFHKKRAEKEEE